MAVYKATHCYPMLNSLDIRLSSTKAEPKPASYLKCKIDTSNKEITGYSIRILDENNNQIFPYDNGDAVISPLSELSVLDNEDMVNSGYNGTFLNIPFFQNNNTNFFTSTGSRLLTSYNAVYYQALSRANYIIDSSDVATTPTDGKWYYDSTTSCLVKDGWDGNLNGEKCLVGEVVLVQSTASTGSVELGGLWEFKQNGSLQRYILSYGSVTKEMTLSNITGYGILIVSGTFHNTVYTYRSSSWYTDENTGWINSAGQTINLFNTGNTYKWEITLYQGEGTETTGSYGQFMNYANMSYDWYDMILQTGTVLGSTPKRIQLGSKSSGTDNDNFIPNGSENDALVLQGRYIELYDSNNAIVANSRAYIKSYDASYGHVYPETTAFSEANIKSANYAQIFKYSNNFDAIEASDIVKCATTSNIAGLYPQYTADVTYTLYKSDGAPVSTQGTEIGTVNIDGITPTKNDTVLCYASSSYSLYKVTAITYDSDSENKKITSITYTAQTFTYDSAKYYYISKGDNYGTQYLHGGSFIADNATGLINVDGYDTVEGDLVLVKNQTNAMENGVYIAHAKGSTNTRWTRSGSFDSWGEFIGKILYVQYGTTNSGKNFESIANSGGSLYTNTTLSGSSPLYFIEEKPLVLYKQSVYRNDINLVADPNVDPTTIKIDGVPIIDGVQVKENMLIYTNYNVTGSGAYGSIVKATNVTSSGWTAVVVEALSAAKKIYINDGKTYGHGIIMAVTRGSSSTILLDTSLYKAYVQKNSTTYTYISPYVNLHKGSALKLQNNKTVTYADVGSTVSPWIKVNNLYKGNGKQTGVWCISHTTLTNSLKSFDESDSDVPYTYEVRSFYRASDETVFYTYEEPYLKLTYNGEGYSDIITWQPYQVTATSTWEEYDVQSNIPTVPVTWLNFMVGNASLSAIAQRYVTLQGQYFQFQQLSWVSYRWVLTDPEGNILQDTGKKFDRKMEVSFYGLSNDPDNNIYYAILYVEDTLKKTLTFTVKLIVSSDTVSSLNLPFHATFDCQTHSVLLEYDDMGVVLPSIPYSYNDAIGYIKENKNLILYWDDSVNYVNNQVSILGANKSQEAPIFGMWTSDPVKIAGLSYTEQMGLQYKHYYPSNNFIVEDNTHCLSMENDEVALETIINLDDNYEGDFLSIDMDGPSTSEFVRLVLDIPSATNGNTSFNVNRFKIEGRLAAIHGDTVQSSVRKSYVKDSNGNDYRWDDSTYNVNNNPFFALQPQYWDSLIDTWLATNKRDFQYLLQSGNDNYPWYIVENSKYYGPTQNCLFGNLCLVKTTDVTINGSAVSAQNLAIYSQHSCGYWIEKQHYIKAQSASVIKPGGGIEFHAMTADAPGVLESDLEWPLSDETNAYWIEQPNDSWYSNTCPYRPGILTHGWSDLVSKTIKSDGGYGLCEYSTHAKYQGVLNKKTWKITIRLQNLTNLYTALSGGSTITFANPSENTYGFLIKIGNTEYGKVVMEEL